jgi:alkanesulfonate monooxygenase SsuD/methylene tetrahydromethanopterin reductase-like flavin-dependent oxidoreductase (luciferase family)
MNSAKRKRGFGVAAAISPNLLEPLAAAAEDSGYSTLWVNDTPDGDGLEALERAAAATNRIRLGVGAIPLDRQSPEDIARSVRNLTLPTDRLIIGIAAGGVYSGSLDIVERGILETQTLTGAAVAVGALGMKMIELAGRRADGVILNWLTPEWAKQSAQAARLLDRPSPLEIIGYVRSALEESRARLSAEAERYASVPAYGRHFRRMGVAAIDTCVIGSRETIAAELSGYEDVLDETVIRAIVLEETLESYLDVLHAGRPDEAG